MAAENEILQNCVSAVFFVKCLYLSVSDNQQRWSWQEPDPLGQQEEEPQDGTSVDQLRLPKLILSDNRQIQFDFASELQQHT